MKTAILICVGVAAVALYGCEMKLEGHDASDPAAITEELKTIETAWQAEFNARDVAKLAGHYTADAGLASPGAAIATDGAAREALLTAMVNDPNFKLEFASDQSRVAKSGDLAYTRGHYAMTYTDPATKQPANGTGSYLTVWQKQADGSWKSVEDFITPGAPPAAATEAAQPAG